MFIALLFLAAAMVSDPFSEIARDAQGKVGAAALNLRTGETLSLNADQLFPMQDVYKLPIAMAMLDLVDQGKFQLDQPQGADMPLRDVIRYAVSENDGTASDVLLRLMGGPYHVQHYLKDLGIVEMRVVSTEAEMAREDRQQYRNWATPRGAVQLLRLFNEGKGLSPASRDYLRELMTKTGTGPNRIKGLLPPDAVVAHKTGTSGSATNDIGLITLPNGDVMALAVFVADSTAVTDTRERVIAQIARAAFDIATKP